MEPERPTPPEPLLDLLRQLPDDARQQLAIWLREIVPDRVWGSVSVTQQDQTLRAEGRVAAAAGIALPATVRLEAPVHSPGPVSEVEWRRDLLVGLVICLVLLTFYDRPFPEGLAEALRDLMLLYLARLST